MSSIRIKEITYNQLRLAIGIFAFILPIICIIGGLIANGKVENAISSYYYTNMRDIFVAILFTVGVFLLSYSGYDLLDRILHSIVGIFAIFTALIPEGTVTVKSGVLLLSPNVSMILHSISAGLLFTLFAVISAFFYTKSDGNPTPEKLIRNKIYIINSIIMAVMLVILIIFTFIKIDFPIILIAEVFLIFSFGINWMVKGGLFLKDAD